jgi:hypothetical protein
MHKRQITLLLGAALGLLLSVSPAFATPMYDTFSSQPGDTFGGTDIPNSWVARTTQTWFQHDGSGNVIHSGTIITDVTAHQRYNNLPLTNDGNGTFFATAGHDNTPGAPSSYAAWNAAFETSYIGDDPTLFGLTFGFVYDSNVFTYISGLPIGYKDSWNLGMSFLYGPSFDPTATGTHTVGVRLFKDGLVIGKDTLVDVSVGSSVARAPDTGSSLTMLSLGFVALGLVSLGTRSR